MNYTSYMLKLKQHARRHDQETRAQLALNFRAMYQSLGLDLSGCAKLLHVTERTLHNWMAAKHDIPVHRLTLAETAHPYGASW